MGKRNEQDYKNVLKRFRNMMTRGEKELPSTLTKTTGKRGRISSCLQTMASKGYNPLIAIQMALVGQVKNVGSE